jgi:hypothetical protein
MLAQHLTKESAYMTRPLPLLTFCLVLAAAACGSVGPNSSGKGGAGGGAQAGAGGNTGSGGSIGSGGATSNGGTTGSGGSSQDAGTDAPATQDASDDHSSGGDAVADLAAGDALPPTDGPVLASCQAIKQANPSAASDVYTISPLGTPFQVFCEMSVDNGGWTAFYIGDNGSTPDGVHFETAADHCPDVRNKCLRRLPSTIDATHDFAVKCGAAVVKFSLGALALDYLKNGLQHQWQPLTNAVTIDTALVGKGNLVTNLWTGDVNNDGWIVAGNSNTTSTAFANGYPAGNWNFCNGTADGTMRVMLFYR